MLATLAPGGKPRSGPVAARVLLRAWLRRLSVGALLCALCAPLLAWPAAAQGAFSIIDDTGATRTGPAPPQRIVSLLPSLTESVCALDACARLVGVDDYSNWPKAVRALPHLGGLDGMSLERIVALRPDWVLLGRSSRLAPRLEALGLHVIVLEPQTLSDAQRTLARLGQALGQPARAAALWHQMQEDIARTAAALPAGIRGQRVYFELGTGPYAAGTASFIGELMARLGLVNIVPAALGPSPKLNPEFVVRADPQWIVLGDDGRAALTERPGWAGITALRRGQVCRLNASARDILMRPGPRMAEAARVLADCFTGRLSNKP
ncbi:MAG: helical backbone metal receptor [Burkholderiaceae bacterium]|jgi:iron complex transport system substrate-binding protein|nr:helical backbone metal receptor [Burkholderiaceae bacterium]